MIKRVLIVAAALVAFTAAPAFAQTPPTGPGYGPPPGAPSLTCSASVASTGVTITCTGSGFGHSLTITIDFHSQAVTVGTVTSDATGAFTAPVTVPNVAPGAHTITATDSAGNTASFAITVPASATGSTSTGGGLAFTGAEIGMMTGGAALLLALGGLIILASRKRANA
ncbi:MAG TPA: hypothetical protein VHA73_10530 [Acidimicrobiales bacterium]|jgi:hypothetical protein|nr:hypothetical protein [Acidimicrobiales bacterium]